MKWVKLMVAASFGVAACETTQELGPLPTASVVICRDGNGQGIVSTGVETPVPCDDAQCVLRLPEGATVLVSARSLGESRFVGWSEDSGCNDASATCVVTLVATSTPTVCAQFQAPQTITAIDIDGPGSVEIDGVLCNSNCNFSRSPDSLVRLHARPDEGHRFVGWSEPCDDFDPRCTISTTRSSTITVRFLPDPGPTAAFPFSGSAMDTTGNGHDGTLIGAVTPTEDRLGQPGAAYLFDGSGTIQLARSEDFGDREAFSVCAWVRQDDRENQAVYTFLSRAVQGDGDDRTDSFSLEVTPVGTVQGSVWTNEGNQGAVNNQSIAQDAWHHICLSYGENFIRLFVDGQVAGTGDLGGRTHSSTSTPTLIGGCGGDVCSDRQFIGALDEVRIWPYVLNRDEARRECDCADLGRWSRPASRLPLARAEHEVVTDGEYIYAVGGRTNAFLRLPTVISARVENGNVGTWREAGSFESLLPEDWDGNMLGAAVIAHDRLYYIGGNPAPGTSSASVYAAPIDAPGQLGTFFEECSLPPENADGTSVGRAAPAVAFDGERIYVAGGAHSSYYDFVDYVEVGPAGLRCPWKRAAMALPEGRDRLSLLHHEGHLIAIGGRNGPTLYRDVLVSKVGQDGEPGPWRLASQLPVGTRDIRTFVWGRHLFSIGGNVGGTLTDRGWAAPIDNDANIAPWTPVTNLPEPRAYFGAAVVGDHLVIVGGEPRPVGSGTDLLITRLLPSPLR